MNITAPAPDQSTGTPPGWVDVLTDLRGLRLAIYDELLRTGERSATQLAALMASPEAPQPTRREAQAEGGVERALLWLGHHRLAVRGASGRWTPRGLAAACHLFITSGPDAAYPLLAPATAETAQKGRGDRRSQGQVAHAEVAGAGTLSRSATPHTSPPRPAIHAPQFFDFGDY